LDGLSEQPGALADGRRCKQDVLVDIKVESQRQVVNAEKPTDKLRQNPKMRIVVRAKGESRFTALYSVNMTHFSRTSSGPTVVRSMTWNGVQVTGDLSFHGHHIVWDTRLSDFSQINVDASTEVYSDTKELAFQLHLNCDDMDGCINDGDKVETRIVVEGPGPHPRRSEVLIVTEATSIPSCERTSVRVEGNMLIVPLSSPFQLRLRVLDVDGLPVFSMWEQNAEVFFGGKEVLMQYAKSSNEYFADIGAELTAVSGTYDVVVTLVRGWNESAHEAQRCVIFQRQIDVAADIKQLIIAGILAAVMGLTVVAIAYGVFKKRQMSRHVLLSLFSVEGALVFEICSEVWSANPTAHHGHAS
jgi:hypothetical protein